MLIFFSRTSPRLTSKLSENTDTINLLCYTAILNHKGLKLFLYCPPNHWRPETCSGHIIQQHPDVNNHAI